MDIVISPTSGIPIYAQITEQVAAQILKGDLPGGSALPPIRSLARQLEVSVITVKKAWEELERAGLIYAIIGKGSFVAEVPAQPLADRRQAAASERLARDLAYYRDLGLSLEEYVGLVRQAWGSAHPAP